MIQQSFDLEIREREYFEKGIYRVLDKLHFDSARYITARSRQHIAVHELRKNIKKIRGIIRLLRHEIGDDKYHELNNHYRNIAQEVAILRDDSSQIELLNSMKKKVNDKSVLLALGKAISQLRKKRNSAFKLFGKEGQPHNIEQMILGMQKLTHELDFSGDPEFFILKSLHRIHTRARSSWEVTGFWKHDEIYHYWRKQVKYLMYHLMVLSKVWPSFIRVYINDLGKLGNLLGKLHDLNLFNEYVNQQTLVVIEGKHKRGVQKIIYSQRASLKKKIDKIGERLFSESSDSFAMRIFDLWLNSVLNKKAVTFLPPDDKCDECCESS